MIFLCLFLISVVCCRTIDLTPYAKDQSKLGPFPWRIPKGLIQQSDTGALLRFDSGVAFRVWAPNAQSVSVAPMTTTSWSSTSMANEGNGTFYVNIGNAQPGDGYNYVISTGSDELYRLDPRAQATSPGDGPWNYSVVVDPSFDWSSTLDLPPVDRLVIYELHVPTFNVPSGQSHGTFASAAQRLPFLQKLGINMVELMPVASYCGGVLGWGYNPCLPYAVMSSLGGPTGLKQFVDVANSLGIGVILDIVWNHADPGNPLLAFDGWAGAAGNGIYYYEDDRSETPWGPRFDYDTPEVFAYIFDSIQVICLVWLVV